MRRSKELKAKPPTAHTLMFTFHKLDLQDLRFFKERILQLLEAGAGISVRTIFQGVNNTFHLIVPKASSIRNKSKQKSIERNLNLIYKCVLFH